MRKMQYALVVIILISVLFNDLFSQNNFTAFVYDAESKSPLVGANAVILNTNRGGASGIDGSLLINKIPNGFQKIIFSYIGFESDTLALTFPLKQPEAVFKIFLKPKELEGNEVIVTTTRTSRHIDDDPVRVEVLEEEEINEKIAEHPSDIARLLGEATGIQIQHTSAPFGSQNIRIQGLSGKYTQILQDGFPLYGGLSSSLSILQIPPLDLEQVEVVKGPSSSLYGSDAIAGIVNLVTKKPTEKSNFTILLNGTSAKGFDSNVFYSRKEGNIGTTVLVTKHTQAIYDADDDGFSDIPDIDRFTVYPKLFYDIDPTTTLMIGFSSTFERRVGGDLHAINNKPDSTHQFILRNQSKRNFSQLIFERKFKPEIVLNIKNSVHIYERKIESSRANFAGQQISTFSEAAFLLKRAEQYLIFGINVQSDKFDENKEWSLLNRDFNYLTLGLFAQGDWQFTEKLSMQIGFREDYNSKFGAFFLPRASGIYKVTPNFSFRSGAGLGYKCPTIFSDEAEEVAFENVLPLNDDMKVEASKGGNFDINYRQVLFDEVVADINQTFFYTRVNNPLVFSFDSLQSKNLYCNNLSGELAAKGFETNLKLFFDDLKFFVGYTYTDAKMNFENKIRALPLTAKDRLLLTLVYEDDERGRFGIETNYIGSQVLKDGAKASGFWLFDVAGEIKLKNYSLFFNLENIFNVRQSNYNPVILPPFSNPSFTEIWAPLEGFVGNAGIKISL